MVERVQEFGRLRGGLEKEIELLGKRVEAQVDEAVQFKNVTKGAVNKMETRMVTFDNRLKLIEDSYKHNNTDLKRIAEDLLSHNERLAKLDIKANDLSSRVEGREKDTKLS